MGFKQLLNSSQKIENRGYIRSSGKGPSGKGTIPIIDMLGLKLVQSRTETLPLDLVYIM
jgi:hypothetical protein